MGEKRIVSYTYCDEPMARRKGLIGNRKTNLPKCRHDCADCLACIVVYTSGNKEHVTTRTEQKTSLQEYI